MKSGVRPWVRAVSAAVVAGQLWVAMSASLTAGAPLVRIAALACGVLAVLGLPSVPLRVTLWVSTATTAVLLGRFGIASAVSGLASLWRPLLWLVLTGVGLGVTAGDRPRSRWSALAASTLPVAVAIGLVSGSALLLGPRVSGWFDAGSTLGETVDRGDNAPANPLDSTSTLDMTTRPRLSDRVVLTVESPVASFWRSEIYDTWDGVRWTRSAGPGGSLITEGTVTPPPEDLAGNNGDGFETRVRVESGYATALPAAPSPVRVEAPGRRLAQRTDGTIVAVDSPLGRGSTYTVTSRQLPIDEDQLRELGRRRVPTGVLDRYARPPVATERTVALARRLTDGIAGNYERVLELTAWMGENTRYDIEAPLSPPGVDVVDHFLFESQLGWCEQIASSLVVLARSAGVPARLATGYVPGEWDPTGGRFIVREQDAHSWAEIWFPEVGWVPFDPTADVPLAGPEAANATTGSDARADMVGILVLIVALLLLTAGPASRKLRVLGDRWRRRRRLRRLVRGRWDVAEEQALDAEGRVWLGRGRTEGETLTSFARSAVGAGAPEEFVDRAAAVELFRYGPPDSRSEVSVGTSDGSGPREA